MNQSSSAINWSDLVCAMNAIPVVVDDRLRPDDGFIIQNPSGHKTIVVGVKMMQALKGQKEYFAEHLEELNRQPMKLKSIREIEREQIDIYS